MPNSQELGRQGQQLLNPGHPPADNPGMVSFSGGGGGGAALGSPAGILVLLVVVAVVAGVWWLFNR
jgi:hypothetical protein